MSRKTISSAPSRVVEAGQVDRVAGVPRVQEPDALDDAPLLDVQRGDDPLGRPSALPPQRRSASQPHRAGVERLADDHALQPRPAPARRGRRTSLQRADAAGRDHRDPGRLRQPAVLVEVGAGHRAVAWRCRCRSAAARRAAAISRASSTASQAVVSRQPCTATRPSRASTPTTSRSPNSAEQRAGGLRVRGGGGADDDALHAGVQRPRARPPGSRTPPPICTGIESAAAIRRTTARFTGSPIRRAVQVHHVQARRAARPPSAAPSPPGRRRRPSRGRSRPGAAGRSCRRGGRSRE